MIELYFIIALCVGLVALSRYGKRPYSDDMVDAFFTGFFWGPGLILWALSFVWRSPKYPGQK